MEPESRQAISVKRIPTNHGKFAIVDDDDFAELSRYTWSLASGEYANTRALGKMHRHIMKAGPGQVVDHINHNTLDNRRVNLRLCTTSENNRNRSPSAGRKYKGVYRAGGGYYRAVIGTRDLGKFPGQDAAALAWNAAALEMYGDFACLNEVQP